MHYQLLATALLFPVFVFAAPLQIAVSGGNIEIANVRRLLCNDQNTVSYLQAMANKNELKLIKANGGYDIWATNQTGAINVGEMLVKNGLIGASDNRYASFEDDAVAERKGIWGTACVGKLTPFEATAKRAGIEPAVLFALAQNESGINGRPWPWTLNANGKARYFRSREDAFRAAESLIKNGNENFDIGTMQVHWAYHKQRFGNSTWRALQPSTNVSVAAQILRENYRSTGNMNEAIRRYHSKNPNKNQPYFNKFITHYRSARSEGSI
ncbi:transglycosylase-like protein with SLT domain [Iodobacter fluviatilis]|uniref:Transglycosylase SLT domain n=1 Tax=Iodobacter fluviatilis TaxID=537 RepID=A0A377Q5R7_9NEIS|nr:transglycosylase-like protein with SLT domain [Iodobacter fluviatilis]STQ90095.1 Transglycosylase SLT domain [Iodobacter fluviatilis]